MSAGDRARAERVAQGLPPMVENESTLRRLAAIFSAPIAAPAASSGLDCGGRDRSQLEAVGQ